MARLSRAQTSCCRIVPVRGAEQTNALTVFMKLRLSMVIFVPQRANRRRAPARTLDLSGSILLSVYIPAVTDSDHADDKPIIFD